MAEEVVRDPTVRTRLRPVMAALRDRLAHWVADTRVQAALVLTALAFMYLAVNFRWLQAVVGSGMVSTFIVQPVLWVAIAAGIVALSRKGGQRLRFQVRHAPLAGLVALFHLSALAIAGLLIGFGSSPYAHSLPAVATNVAFFVTALAGVELARAFLLSAWRPRSRVTAVLALGVLFAFLSLPLSHLTGPQTGEATFRLLGLRVLPTLGEHLLTTYIALVGGPLAALAYRGALQGFEWLSPALPSLPWALSGFLGLLVPYLGYLAFRSLTAGANGTDARETRETKRGSTTTGWLVLSLVSAGIIWFSLGLFPYHPLSVAGQSMAPTIQRGDLAIMHSADPSSIRVGDVIQYRSAEASILHRVIEVRRDASGARVFVTRGDANDVADPSPVATGQVTGRMVLSVPKVGWLGIFASRSFRQ